jgi:hypothetical protein
VSEATKVIRVIPTTQVTGYWHHDYSDYPDEIKVKMANGESVTYVRKIEQPHPKCQKAIDLIRVMNECTYGGYQAKHEKKAGAAATATDQ